MLAILTAFGTIAAACVDVVGKALQSPTLVLLLLGASIGFYGGDDFGRWRQSAADAAAIRHGGGQVQPAPSPHVRPIRDLIRFIVGEKPASSAEENEE